MPDTRETLELIRQVLDAPIEPRLTIASLKVFIDSTLDEMEDEDA